MWCKNGNVSLRNRNIYLNMIYLSYRDAHGTDLYASWLCHPLQSSEKGFCPSLFSCVKKQHSRPPSGLVSLMCKLVTKGSLVISPRRLCGQLWSWVSGDISREPFCFSAKQTRQSSRTLQICCLEKKKYIYIYISNIWSKSKSGNRNHMQIQQCVSAPPRWVELSLYPTSGSSPTVFYPTVFDTLQ